MTTIAKAVDYQLEREIRLKIVDISLKKLTNKLFLSIWNDLSPCLGIPKSSQNEIQRYQEIFIETNQSKKIQ